MATVEQQIQTPAPFTVDMTIRDSNGKFLRFAPQWIDWFNRVVIKQSSGSADTAAITDMGYPGLAVKAGPGQWVARTLTQGSGIEVSHGSGQTGNPTVSHGDTSSVTNLTSDNAGGVVIQDFSISFDSFGHVQAVGVSTVDLDTRYEGQVTAGTTGQFWRGDKGWSNVLVGAFNCDGLQVSEAANGKQGTVTLVAGTATVANTSITANSRIFLTGQDDNGGTPGFLRVSGRTVGIDFTITSSSATDTSIVAFEIFEPGV